MGKKKVIDEIMNITYPGLTMLYRDVNLGDLGSLYKKGMIIQEKGFIDTSKRGGGIITTHRFAIFSKHYMDVAEYEQFTNWGLCIIQRNSYFKIIDVYKANGKTQITLLHLPEQYWWFFENVKIGIDQQVVDFARKRLEECLVIDPVLELTSENWLERCSFPLGMDDRGNRFPLSEDFQVNN